MNQEKKRKQNVSVAERKDCFSGDLATDFRGETRRQRYYKKVANANIMPIAVATINFSKEANIAYVVRAAACFGAFEVCVIGDTPNRDIMNDLSGSTYDYVKFNRFSNTSSFIEYCKMNNISLITFELPNDNFPSTPLNEYKFDFSKRHCIVVGHETIGVPVEIMVVSERVYIPMPGVGFCLNTSQAANIAMYEAARQYSQER